MSWSIVPVQSYSPAPLLPDRATVRAPHLQTVLRQAVLAQVVKQALRGIYSRISTALTSIRPPRSVPLDVPQQSVIGNARPRNSTISVRLIRYRPLE